MNKARTPMQWEKQMTWMLTLVCCGRYDGTETFETWEEADAFRESYTSGGGVAEHGYSAKPGEWGHQRAAIIKSGVTGAHEKMDPTTRTTQRSEH